VLNHSWRATHLPRERWRVRELPKAAIENLIAIVGQVRTAVGLQAQFGQAAQRHDLPLDNSPRKRDYLDWQWKLAEHGNNLAGVSDHHHLLRCRSDDLLASQRPAAAFDQIQLGIDFIGAIDGDVDFRMFVQRTAMPTARQMRSARS
jgi:hypothetical protein